MRFYKQVLGIGVSVALMTLAVSPTLAFVGPGSGQNPGSGGGLFYVDSNRNIGFGTESPTPTETFDDNSAPHGYIFMIASSSNPGIALRNTNSGVTYIWSVRGGGRLHLFREGGGYGGNIIMSVDWYGNVGINKFQATAQLDVGGNINSDGTITASSTITGQNFSGIGTNITAINPANITGNPFASANYAFPSALAIGTSTTIGLPTNGLQVMGTTTLALNSGANVGIGTASPGRLLHLVKNQPLRMGTATEYIDYVQRAADYWGWLSSDSLYMLSWELDTSNVIMGEIGNVGIGTSTPSHKLTVYGSIAITAKTGQLDLTASSSQSIAMASGDITGVNKLTVGTIDPLYQIGMSKYATYTASVVGGVKEEYVGRGRLAAGNQELYEYVIDFDNVKQGSDLWVWYKIVDFEKENVDAFVTSYGQSADIYYVIEGNRLVFRGDKPVEFSYRLIGKRYDWRSWPTYAKDQTERPSFIINE